MRSLEEIVADYQLRTTIPAIALSLYSAKVRPKQVFGPDEITNLVERRFNVRLDRAAVIAAIRQGAHFSLWRVHGVENPTPHIEILPKGIITYIESLRHITDSELIALETVGRTHFLESLDGVMSKANKDFDFNQSQNHDYKGDAGFNRLQDGLDFQSGLSEYRAHGRSAISRKIDKEINWSKWGAVAGIAALPLALAIWWLSK